jgi:hypothetical protein
LINFNQNSSVTFVNANTTRNGDFRANVSALLFDLNTKANTYNLYGNFKYNAINTVEDYNGFKTEIDLKKPVESTVDFRENMFLKL